MRHRAHGGTALDRLQALGLAVRLDTPLVIQLTMTGLHCLELQGLLGVYLAARSQHGPLEDRLLVWLQGVLSVEVCVQLLDALMAGVRPSDVEMTIDLAGEVGVPLSNEIARCVADHRARHERRASQPR